MMQLRPHHLSGLTAFFVKKARMGVMNASSPKERTNA